MGSKICEIIKFVELLVGVYTYHGKPLESYMYGILFQALKVMDFNCGPWKVPKNYVFEKCTCNYSRSSPCDHSRKRPALVTATIVKPRLNVP